MKNVPPYVLWCGVAVLALVTAAHAFLPEGKAAAVITDVATIATVLAALAKGFESARLGAENKAELHDQSETLGVIKEDVGVIQKDVNSHTEMLQKRGDDAIEAHHASQAELVKSQTGLAAAEKLLGAKPDKM
jgi:hypothetical protein